MEKGLVSILIPCYNCEKYLEDCLLAILNQSYSKVEVIIVNDGSTDNSEKIIDKYTKLFDNFGKKIIKINQTNQGQASACNNGLKFVNGEFFYWQDADDIIEKDAIKTLVDFLEENKDFDLVRGNIAYRSEKDFEKIYKIGKPVNPTYTDIFEEYLFEKGTYSFCGVFMIRMSYFDQRNPERKLYISPGGQNYQILLPIIYNAKCGYVDNLIYNYRVRDMSHSHSTKTLKDKLKRCDIHKDIIINTLDIINDMPDKEKKFYIRKIKVKYLKRKIKIIMHHFVKKLLKREK